VLNNYTLTCPATTSEARQKYVFITLLLFVITINTINCCVQLLQFIFPVHFTVWTRWRQQFCISSNTRLLSWNSTGAFSSRRRPQQVVHVGPVEFGERHDAWTNGQHYTASDREPTNQVSAWQSERESRPTHQHPREDPRQETAFMEFKLYWAILSHTPAWTSQQK